MELEQLINQYDDITILRHVNPDLDAFGSQFGWYYYLKENYPHKNIQLQGEFTSNLVPYYQYEEIKMETKKGLAIICDTANRERIDGNIEGYEKIIKIDHHLVVDSFGDYNIENIKASSTCEIVSLLMKEMPLPVSKKAASCLYMGIIGDSNRFLFNSTTTKTFEAASFLLESGIILSDIYDQLYVKSQKEIEIKKYIYNQYQVNGQVAYYYLNQEALDTLGISREEGSNYVNMLSNVEEFKIYAALTENVKENNVRVSLRSRHYNVNQVAKKFNGGGHLLASGCNLEKIEDLPLLLAELNQVIKETDKNESLKEV